MAGTKGMGKGNQNAALKSGEMGRIQFTVSLSGEALQRFVRSLHLDPATVDEQELRERVVAAARERIGRMFETM